MEKIKFKNPRKYKGIVEKVFVKDGQAVEQGQVLAQISTQLERFKIESPIEGVIRNIYIIESLIVSHGDVIFDVMNQKELAGVLKKPQNIGDTLREALTENGFLESLNDENGETISFEPADDFDLNTDIKPEFLSQNEKQSVEAEHPVEEIKVEEEIVQTTTKTIDFSNQMPTSIGQQSIERSEKISDHHDDLWEQRGANAISSDDSVTKELELLSHLTAEGAHEVDKEVSIKEMAKDFDIQLNEATTSSQSVETLEQNNAHLNFEELNVFAKPQSSPIENEHEYPQPITVSDSITQELTNLKALKLEDEKDIKIFENHNPEIRETQILKTVNESQFLSKFASDENEDLISLEDVVIDSLEVEPEQTEEKPSDVEQKTVEEIKVINQEYDDSSIKSQLAQLEEKHDQLNKKLSEMKFNKIDPANVNITSKQTSSINFEVDVTALLHLHTLMFDPYKAKGVELNLNTFYLKALKMVLNKFDEFDYNNNSTISLARSIGNKFGFVDIVVENSTSIIDIAKQVDTNQEIESAKNIMLIDLSQFNVLSSSIQLDESSIISLSVGAVHSKLKGEMILSNYVNVCVNFDTTLIDIKDAIEFTKEFNDIIQNPGLLI
ncbi:biotin/lipoyl-containing protein [Spiroplasma culicicola]|uniref:Lipoyl-binding domain-containing protein n=1 Tax=Spiroplasma culicicola AES-1 TaxID=1276246 RepID=W6A8D8_9MOLU|nr:biotin/lipoyl-binding protein [Spiroplasma culicicola]AHI53155.1 hypothetical protein SCULI_v1c08150 [Spiroplasma culicicola AES-1]